MQEPALAGATLGTGAPPRERKRLVVVDAVRAGALFGVLVMNLRDMSGHHFLSAQALAAIQGPLDRAVDLALRILVDGKALSAFSFLFGLSFTLLLESLRNRDVPVVPLYARRLVALALFGVLNFTFFFWGDILIIYAALGGLLVIADRLPQRAVLALSALLLLGVPAALAATGAVRAPEIQTPADIAALSAFGSPSYIAAIWHSAHRYVGLSASHSEVGLQYYTNILGLFLLGLWTGRRRIPQRLGESRRLLRRIAATALPVGLAVSAAAVLLPRASPLATLMLAGTPVLALGYLAAAALVLDRPAGRRASAALAPTGRMALTNYLAIGLIGQFVFYGWGLDLIGTVGMARVLLISVAAYGLLLWASWAWLRSFRMGPAEWVWRCLTYLETQPLRRRA